MFDIGALELLVIVIVAIIVIGPKDMPQALRVAGRWVGKLRRASAQFRSGFDSMVREAEMEEMERKWKEQNQRIMAETPPDQMSPLHDAANGDADIDTDDEKAAPSASAESRANEASKTKIEEEPQSDSQPSLPLDAPKKG